MYTWKEEQSVWPEGKRELRASNCSPKHLRAGPVFEPQVMRIERVSGMLYNESRLNHSALHRQCTHSIPQTQTEQGTVEKSGMSPASISLS